MEKLADEGPEAFRTERQGPATADELEPGNSASLYLREISRTPLLTAEEAEERVLADTMDEALSEHLTPREKDIVRLRFGLDRGGMERTLGEVGKLMGISRERARQLEAESLRKLRHAPPFRQRFYEYASWRAT